MHWAESMRATPRVCRTLSSASPQSVHSRSESDVEVQMQKFRIHRDAVGAIVEHTGTLTVVQLLPAARQLHVAVQHIANRRFVIVQPDIRQADRSVSAAELILATD